MSIYPLLAKLRKGKLDISSKAGADTSFSAEE